ncbi:hypothetical protein NKG94_36925 [Micromonospora sp. M12]
MAIMPMVRKIRNAARGPSNRVMGVIGSEMDNTDVLAIRLTPSGTFI